jgi:hypothetical protein
MVSPIVSRETNFGFAAVFDYEARDVDWFERKLR